MKRKNDTFLDQLEYYFSTYLPVAKGLSKATITSYKATFRIFIEYMYSVKNIPADRITFDLLDQQIITEFLNWLETARKCSISTRNQRLSAIAAFAVYAQNRNFEAATTFRNSVLKVPKKKAPRKERNSFLREEVKILLELPDSNSHIGLRDKTLLCLMYASGMRAQEICELVVGDIQFYSDRAGINVHGKGQKIRRIGIPTDAAKMLKKYIEYRNIQGQKSRHVFSSQTHEKMTVSCIEEIYSKYVSIAKKENPSLFNKSYTPHSMRHTTATHMLEVGVPIIVVKNFLGHVSLQTTQIYIEVSQDTMDKQLKNWNDKWFLNHSFEQNSNTKSNVPDFLK